MTHADWTFLQVIGMLALLIVMVGLAVSAVENEE
jgi:hypothetical protein